MIFPDFWFGFDSFEHDFVEMSGEAVPKDAPTMSAAKAVESGPSEPTKTVWNAKVNHESS